MTTREKVTLSHIVAFAGFFTLMGAWVVQGGNDGRRTFAIAAFVWMLFVALWQNLALCCLSCGHRIFAGGATPWPIPVKCAQCGREL